MWFKVIPIVDVNITGKSGGTFNVSKGTLYFCNNHFGTHLFYPMPFSSMPGINTDITDYPSLFTGMLGQKGNPTYSNVSVSLENIIITTNEIINGNSQLLDEITITKCNSEPVCVACTHEKLTFTNSQSLNNVDFVITDELRIKNNATVTFINSTLRFYENAKVIVEAGSNLIIDGSTFSNACDGKMWQGIIVEGNQ